MKKYGRIYGIHDKKHKKYVYVGKTERLYDYKPHGKVMRKLFLKYPKRYTYRTIEHDVPKISLNKREKLYIKKYKTHNFFNFTEGGDGGDTLSHHPKKKINF